MQRKRLGYRISKARTKLGISTQDLAQRIGKSQATVSRIENGKQGVSIELISQIANVLRIHPFSLLTEHSAACHSSLLPGGVVHLDQSMSLLCCMLQNGRLRSHMSIEIAARQLAISPEELVAFEAGVQLPPAEQITKIADLYTLDAKHLYQVYRLEQDWPQIGDRLRLVESMLSDCYQLFLQTDGHASKEMVALRDKLHAFFSTDEQVHEHLGDYFSIGHLSDTLLKALQDPAFHQQAEELAQEWDSANQTAYQEDAPATDC